MGDDKEFANCVRFHVGRDQLVAALNLQQLRPPLVFETQESLLQFQ